MEIRRAEIWKDRFHERGTTGAHLCRAGDEGGYTIGNVRVDTAEANRAEATVSGRRKSLKAAWPNGSQAFWLHERSDYGRDYFRVRAKLEWAQENGIELDES
jgi:hypothetical protein